MGPSAAGAYSESVMASLKPETKTSKAVKPI